MELTDPLALLREARAVARRRGHDCTGATLQEDDDGFSAWLYEDTGETQRPLFDHVDILPSALEAAQACLLLAGALPVRAAPPPES